MEPRYIYFAFRARASTVSVNFAVSTHPSAFLLLVASVCGSERCMAPLVFVGPACSLLRCSSRALPASVPVGFASSSVLSFS